MKFPAFRFPCRMAFVLAMGWGAGQAGASAESDAVLANFGPLEWIGGLEGQDPTNTNQSEWLSGFEGKPATKVELSEPHSATGDLSGSRRRIGRR